MKRILVKLKGITPLLHHRMPEEALMGLIPNLKHEKKKNVEEKTPREIAEQHAYKSNGRFVIPGSFLGGALKHVAGDYKQKSSGRKSLKPVVNGAIRPELEFIDLLDENEKIIKDFEVDIRQARNHQKGAVAVCRPRFDRWKINLVLVVDDSIVPIQILKDMLDDSGKRAGIGSFRVQNSGYFGQYTVTEFSELKD